MSKQICDSCEKEVSVIHRCICEDCRHEEIDEKIQNRRRLSELIELRKKYVELVALTSEKSMALVKRIKVEEDKLAKIKEAL